MIVHISNVLWHRVGKFQGAIAPHPVECLLIDCSAFYQFIIFIQQPSWYRFCKQLSKDKQKSGHSAINSQFSPRTLFFLSSCRCNEVRQPTVMPMKNNHSLGSTSPPPQDQSIPVHPSFMGHCLRDSFLNQIMSLPLSPHPCNIPMDSPATIQRHAPVLSPFIAILCSSSRRDLRHCLFFVPLFQ